jgi:3-carboxy-cis,cis-muconate cycloisomerase
MYAQTLNSQFSTPAMDEVFSVSRQMECMTRFEWALLFSLEANGIASSGAASAMEPLLDAKSVDPLSLAEEERLAGNLAIPFVRALTGAVRLHDEEAARYVHLGATSQDVLDTALVLQMRDALALIRSDLQRLEGSLAQLTREHAGTILSGRTWLQDGPPVTLGLKIAGLLAALRRHQERLEAAGTRAIVLQFGGAVGTLAALGDKGTAVSAVLAQKLGLAEPLLPWHTQRDNLAELATCLGLLVGTLGKMARDVSLLMQTEVGEVFEPAAEGRGGSSTMPHKRNPVASAAILAIATRVPALVSTLLHAMIQEHERGLGGWQAEWKTLPEIFCLTAAALSRANEIADGLEVDQDRMKANLEATNGLVLTEAVSVALAEFVGRAQAHELMERAAKKAIQSKKHLRAVLLEMPEIRQHLSDSEVDHLLDPKNYLGSAQEFIERVLGGADASH